MGPLSRPSTQNAHWTFNLRARDNGPKLRASGTHDRSFRNFLKKRLEFSVNSVTDWAWDVEPGQKA